MERLELKIKVESNSCDDQGYHHDAKVYHVSDKRDMQLIEMILKKYEVKRFAVVKIYLNKGKLRWYDELESYYSIDDARLRADALNAKNKAKTIVYEGVDRLTWAPFSRTEALGYGLAIIK